MEGQRVQYERVLRAHSRPPIPGDWNGPSIHARCSLVPIGISLFEPMPCTKRTWLNLTVTMRLERNRRTMKAGDKPQYNSCSRHFLCPGGASSGVHTHNKCSLEHMIYHVNYPFFCRTLHFMYKTSLNQPTGILFSLCCIKILSLVSYTTFCPTPHVTVLYQICVETCRIEE